MKGENKQRRRKSYYFGLFAEKLVKIYLIFKGYKILSKRYKTYVGEVDVIAKKGKVIAFVEVKARRSSGDMYEVLSFVQQHRIKRAASVFLCKNPSYNSYYISFDLVLYQPPFKIKHLKNAWD